MTSDVKVGLLLGLVFIVIIAFLINGLPNLLNRNNSEIIVSNSVADTVDNRGPRDKAEDIVRSFSSPSAANARPQTISPVRERQVSTPMNIRYQTAETEQIESPDSDRLAAVTIPVNNVSSTPALPARTVETESKPLLTFSDLVSQQPSRTVEKPIIKPVVKQIPPIAAAESKTYVVQADDNLTKIAIKFYGKIEGSKYDNIMKIYEANKKSMSSPDSIYEGQKLVIPAISNQAGGYAATKIETKSYRSNSNSTDAVDTYVVREYDSLWSIAQDRLGDGNRYPEIIRLNKAALPDEDYLTVGMKLKIPRK